MRPLPDTRPLSKKPLFTAFPILYSAKICVKGVQCSFCGVKIRQNHCIHSHKA